MFISPSSSLREFLQHIAAGGLVRPTLAFGATVSTVAIQINGTCNGTFSSALLRLAPRDSGKPTSPSPPLRFESHHRVWPLDRRSILATRVQPRQQPRMVQCFWVPAPQSFSYRVTTLASVFLVPCDHPNDAARMVKSQSKLVIFSHLI